LLIGVIIVVVTVWMKRRGAFAPRMTVMLREDVQEPERSGFAVTAAGRPSPATVQLEYAEDTREIQAAAGDVPAFSSLRRAVFRLPAGLTRELKVWVHRVTAAGDSEGLPGQLDVRGGGEVRHSALSLIDEAVVLPYGDAAGQVDIDLERGD
jgi:hypothetical protein